MNDVFIKKCVRERMINKYGFTLDDPDRFEELADELMSMRKPGMSDDTFIDFIISIIEATYGYPRDHDEVVLQMGDKNIHLPAWVLDRNEDNERPHVWGAND